MKIKLIAIDIDGTLLNTHGKLTDKVKAAIKQAINAGIKVVIATGRPLSGTKNLLQELSLDDKADQYVVCFGGAVVQSTNGRVIYRKGIEYSDFCDLEALARKKQLHFHVISLDRIYTCNRDIGKYTLHEANLVNLPVSYRTPEELRDIPLIKGMYIDEPAILDERIGNRSDFDYLKQFDFMKTAPFYFEAYAKGVNKGSALQHLCDELGITSENVMAIGNEENDIPMIKFASCGIAVNNATPPTLEAANIVVADNDHDGVAEAIKMAMKMK